MANNTIQLRDLIKTGKLTWYNKYTIWNEEKRDWLNKQIDERFMFREIGYPNPARWDFEMSRNMERLMCTKFNRLFELLEMDYNPLYNIDLTETETHTREQNRDTSGDATRNAETTGTTTNETSGTTNTTASGTTETESENESTLNQTTAQSGGGTSTTTSDAGAATMPDDITETEVYYNDRQHSAADTKSTQNAETTSEGKSGTKDTTSEHSNSATNQNTSASAKGNTSATTSEKANTSENEKIIEKFTHETKTLGSSAGLSFANAMMQQIKMVNETMLLDQLFDALEPLFYSVWGGVNFD